MIIKWVKKCRNCELWRHFPNEWQRDADIKFNDSVMQQEKTKQKQQQSDKEERWVDFQMFFFVVVVAVVAVAVVVGWFAASETCRILRLRLAAFISFFFISFSSPLVEGPLSRFHQIV